MLTQIVREHFYVERTTVQVDQQEWTAAQMNALITLKVVLSGLMLVIAMTSLLPSCKKTAKNLAICA